MRKQAPNSPETNIFDLCLFASWSRRNHKLQLHNSGCSKHCLWENVKKSWGEYPAAELFERAFQNRKLALQEIIKHKGGNRFDIPHISKAKRAKLLPKTQPFLLPNAKRSFIYLKCTY